MAANRSKGFTLVDLLVVVGCVAILAVFPACTLQRAVDQARRQADAVSCQVNLKGIGMAVAMYKGEDRYAKFPLLWTSGQSEADIKADHTAPNVEVLRTKLVGHEAAMQNVWLLIEKGLVTEEAFWCPADMDHRERQFADRADRKARRVGWWSSRQFSYGMHSPYRSTKAQSEGIDNKAWLGAQLKGSFVIMADKNPAMNNTPAAGVSPDNPPSNHGDLGFGYLTFNGVVGWKKGQADSKVNGDDVYTIDQTDNPNPATPAGIDDQYITRHPAFPTE